MKRPVDKSSEADDPVLVQGIVGTFLKSTVLDRCPIINFNRPRRSIYGRIQFSDGNSFEVYIRVLAIPEVVRGTKSGWKMRVISSCCVLTSLRTDSSN